MLPFCHSKWKISRNAVKTHSISDPIQDSYAHLNLLYGSNPIRFIAKDSNISEAHTHARTHASANRNMYENVRKPSAHCDKSPFDEIWHETWDAHAHCTRHKAAAQNSKKKAQTSMIEVKLFAAHYIHIDTWNNGESAKTRRHCLPMIAHRMQT